MLPMLSPAPSATGLFDRAYFNKVLSYNPIAYWPLWEPSGAVAHCLTDPLQNGTYSNVTLDQPGIGDGRTSASFNGATSYVNIYSATFRDAFNGPAGTISAWARVSGAGIWTDGANRRIVTLSRADGQNQVLLFKATDNKLWFYYEAGNVADYVQAVTTATDFFHVAMTWDVNAGVSGELKAYLGGSQTGATQTTLGTWAGQLVNTATVIGAIDVGPNDLWSGFIQHAAVFSYALSPDAIAALSRGAG